MDREFDMLITTGGFVLVLSALWDAFVTVVLPRPLRGLRVSGNLIRIAWRGWITVGRLISSHTNRETFLSFFGPLSMLFRLVLWAGLIIVGFAVLLWGTGATLSPPDASRDFASFLYISATTFFTLGPGDITPESPMSRLLTVIEVATGIGFFALVIGYLPLLEQAFSQREISVALLDSRAGMPPSAAEVLRRYLSSEALNALEQLLLEWERWSAELLESHLSHPVLLYYRSQHAGHSWVMALTTILDVSTLGIVGIVGTQKELLRPSWLAFHMARRAVFELTYMLRLKPQMPPTDRLPHSELQSLRDLLATEGIILQEGDEADARLHRLRSEYEPYVYALATHLFVSLPAWIPEEDVHEVWQKTFGR